MPRPRPRFVMHEAEAEVQAAILEDRDSDRSSYFGAQRERDRLIAFWRKQKPARRFEADLVKHGPNTWGLVSNCVGGVPPLLHGEE